MKPYTNTKTGVTVVSGTVKEISPDRLSVVVESVKWNRETKQNDTVSFNFRAAIPVDANITPGALVAATGAKAAARPGTPAGIEVYELYSIDVPEKGGKMDIATISVVSGQVVFARMNEEKEEDGTPKMTKEQVLADGTVKPAKPRKPHFDLGIQVVEGEGEETKRVLHTIRYYNNFDGDKPKDEQMRKRLAAIADPDKTGTYDFKEHPVFATIVTQPGQESSYTKEYNGKEYVNYSCSHMGINSWDLEAVKEADRTRLNAEAAARTYTRTSAPAQTAQAPVQPAAPTPVAQPAPQPATPAQPVQAAAPAQNGFEAEVPTPDDVNLDDLFV